LYIGSLTTVWSSRN